MFKTIAAKEGLASAVLGLLVVADHLRRNVGPPTHEEIVRYGAIALAVAVVFALFWPFVVLFLMYLIPMTLPAAMLFGGFAFGVGLTSDARRSGDKGRWAAAVLAWAAFLLMADSCLRTGTVFYHVD